MGTHYIAATHRLNFVSTDKDLHRIEMGIFALSTQVLSNYLHSNGLSRGVTQFLVTSDSQPRCLNIGCRKNATTAGTAISL